MIAMKRKIATLAAVAVAVACSMPALADTTLVINAFLPPQDPMNVDVLRPWADDVTKATEGRVKIQIPPSSVAAPDQLWNSVRSGVVDGAYLSNVNLTGQLKLMQLPHLPFLGTNAKANSLALWQTYKKYFEAAGEYRDVHLLGVMVIPAGIMYGLKGPILANADLRGTKVWALPGMPAKLMEMSKAGVVATPAAKMSEIVSGGTVDAFVGIPDMYADAFKVIRYAKNATTVPGGISTSCFSFVVNKQKWQSLEPRDREIITKLSGEALADRMKGFDRAEDVAHRSAVQAGLKYHAAPDAFVAELKKEAESLEGDWLANAKSLKVDGAAAMQYYRTQSALGSK